jgi:hypothetical protein
LIRLGADTLLRDSQKNTPADTAKLRRKQELYEVLKWAARRQANGAEIPAGGLLGESETDRKAKLLRDDAEFARLIGYFLQVIQVYFIVLWKIQ